MRTRKPTAELEPAMSDPDTAPVETAPPLAEAVAEEPPAPEEVIPLTKAEVKAHAEQAARLAAGLSVPPATLPPSAAAWRALAEQAAQLAVVAAAIADLGEAS